MTLPADGIYHFNNNKKPWRIHAQTVTSRSGESLVLKSAENYNLFLDASGATVTLNNNLLVTKNAVTFGAGTIFSGNMVTDSSAVQIPITLNNYEFANANSMNSNLTKTPDTWIDLTNNGYSVPFTPKSARSKIYLRLNISYLSSNESEQLISFRLKRSIAGGPPSEIFTDSDIGILMGVSNSGIYTADYIDEPNTTQQISYRLEYKIGSDPAISIDVSSGVLGYDVGNTNFFMAQELYVPPSDSNQQMGPDGQPMTFSEVLGSGLSSVFNSMECQTAQINTSLNANNVTLNDGTINNITIGNITRNNAFFNQTHIHGLSRFYNNIHVYDANNNQKIQILNGTGEITTSGKITINNPSALSVNGHASIFTLGVSSGTTLQNLTANGTCQISATDGNVTISRNDGNTTIMGNLICADDNCTTTFRTLVNLDRISDYKSSVHLNVAGTTNILSGTLEDLATRNPIFNVAPNQASNDPTYRFNCKTLANFYRETTFHHTPIFGGGLNITHTTLNNGNAISINNGSITMSSSNGSINCKNITIQGTNEPTQIFTTNGTTTTVHSLNTNGTTNLGNVSGNTTTTVRDNFVFNKEIRSNDNTVIIDEIVGGVGSGKIYCSGDLVAQGVNIQLGNSYNGSTLIKNDLTVDKTSTFTDDVTLGENSLFKPNGGIQMDTDKFTVQNGSGNTSIAGTLDVNGAVNLATAGVATTVEGSLTVNQTSTFKGEVTVQDDYLFRPEGGINMDDGQFTVTNQNGNIYSAGSLNVDGTVNLATTDVPTTIRGSLTVNQTSTFNGTVRIQDDYLFRPEGGINMDDGQFTVTNQNGNIYSAGSLNVDGTVNLAVAGVGTTVEGSLQVNQTSLFNGEVKIQDDHLFRPEGGINMDDGQFTVTNQNGNIYSAGSLDVNGAVNLASSGVATTVEGSLEVNQTSTLNGNVTIKNSLHLYQSDGDANSITKFFSQKVNNEGQLTIDPYGDGANGHVIIAGNLTVQGTTTTIESSVLDIGDKIIKLNKGLESGNNPSENAGLEINRGSQPNSLLIWDESNDRWTIKYANNGAQDFYTDGSIICNQLLKNGGGVVSGTIQNATNSENTRTSWSNNNTDYPMTFVHAHTNNEMQQIKVDGGNNIRYNPYTNILTVPTLTASFINGFSAQGPINFTNQNMQNVNITSGGIAGTTINGTINNADITIPTAKTLNIQNGKVSVSQSSSTISNILYYDTTSQAIKYGAAPATEINHLTVGNNVSIGTDAGMTNQATYGIAIGINSGKSNQGDRSVSIGYGAGETTQGYSAVAIGELAGSVSSKQNSIAIGAYAGYSGQGHSSIAIGREAGKTNQAANSIVLNAQGAGSNFNPGNSGFYVKPIRDNASSTSHKLVYDTGTGEISYQPDSGGGGSINHVTVNNSPGGIGIGENTTSLNNGVIAIGHNASQNNSHNSSGVYRLAIGYEAGNSQQNGYGLSLGYRAGKTNQGSNSIAIGTDAASTGQSYNCIAIGRLAGLRGQSAHCIAIGDNTQAASHISPNPPEADAIAIGHDAGVIHQRKNSVAIGTTAGYSELGEYSVAIGHGAGNQNLSSNRIQAGSVAIGVNAGNQNQGKHSVAIGRDAGKVSQGYIGIAMGNYSGNNNQGSLSIAIGASAGQNNQPPYSVAIGHQAGLNGTSNHGPNGTAACVAIGLEAGYRQAYNCIAIGKYAGRNTSNNSYQQPPNSICLNAWGTDMFDIAMYPSTSGFFVAPIRNTTQIPSGSASRVLHYDTATSEIVHLPENAGLNSDDRLKHEEIDISNATNIIEKLQPKLYKKSHSMYHYIDISYTDLCGNKLMRREIEKDSSGNIIYIQDSGNLGSKGEDWVYEAGLIAQDVNEISELKEFVIEGDDIRPWSLKYSDINMYHLSCTKELIDNIKLLKSENSLLKEKLNEILSEMGKNQI